MKIGGKLLIAAIILVCIIALGIFGVSYFNKDNKGSKDNNENQSKNITNTAVVPNIDSEIKSFVPSLESKDNSGNSFSFEYENETFVAVYSNDNWHIEDSYKIYVFDDIKAICEALINIHPIHGSDMISYRTADDLANEWFKHSILYYFLPDDSSWKDNAKDVDLDPYDQNKTLVEMYEERTGSKLDLDGIDLTF